MVVAEREEYDVALVDPDFLSEFASDVGEALFAVEAESFKAAITEHLDYLGIFYVAECVRQAVGGLEGKEGREGDVPWPSSLKVSSRFSLSFSFFPRRRFLPP